MIVGEMGNGAIVELSLNERADVCALCPPGLWQELANCYQALQLQVAPVIG